MRAALLALAACHVQAQPASPAAPALPAITLCKTTEAELRAALGEPSRHGVLHDTRIAG